jgi:hypothetical protein
VWRVIVEIDGCSKVFPLPGDSYTCRNGTVVIPKCGHFTVDQLAQIMVKKYRAFQVKQEQTAAFYPGNEMAVSGTDPTLTSFVFGATGNNMSYNFNAPPVPQPAPVFNFSPTQPAAFPVVQQATFTPSFLGGPNVSIVPTNPRALNATRKARKFSTVPAIGMRMGTSNPTLF